MRKRGDRCWAHVVIDPIRDPSGIRDAGGEMVSVVKITRDITERRNGRLALERAREALLQLQKRDAIGQLAGGVAHNFNNLRMAISSSLELLRKRLPGDAKIAALVDNAFWPPSGAYP